METILLLVAVAACPIMMIWCMRSMRGNGRSEAAATSGSDEATRLRQEIEELRAEIHGRRRSDVGTDG